MSSPPTRTPARHTALRRLADALGRQRGEITEAWTERIRKSTRGRRLAGDPAQGVPGDLATRSFDAFQRAVSGSPRAFRAAPLAPFKELLASSAADTAGWCSALFDICRDALDADHEIPPRDLIAFRNRLLNLQERVQTALVLHATAAMSREAQAGCERDMQSLRMEVRAARESYRNLVERLDEAIFTLDVQGRFRSASGRGLRTLGLTEKELLGKPITAVIPRSYREQVRELRSLLLREKRLRGVTIKVENARGREIILEVNASLLEERGRPAGALGIARDVTSRVRLQEQVRESRDYLALLVESSVDGIIAWSSEGNITFFSRGAEEIFGYASSEVLHKPLGAFFSLPDGGHDDLFRQIKAAGGRLRDRECDCRGRNGSEIKVSYSAGFLHDDAEEIIGAIAVCKDITDARRKEGDIRAKNEELEAYARTVTHDLRGPLVSIHGYASLMEEAIGTRIPESVAYYLKRIHENAGTMGRLISDVLEYSTAGRQKGTPYWVRLGQVLGSLAQEIKPQLDRSGVRMEIQRPMPEVLADETRLRQVFSNLVTNALRHLGGARDPLIEISAESSERGHTICVADHGPGIPRKEQAHVFDLFYSRAARSGENGSGIGLAIVKKTVESCGGRVWVESESGRGCRFFVYFPETKN